MAWAHELVVGSRPWDVTSQVSAHSIKTIRFKSLVFLDDKVSAKRKKSISKLAGKKAMAFVVKVFGSTHVASPFKPWARERSLAPLDSM